MRERGGEELYDIEEMLLPIISLEIPSLFNGKSMLFFSLFHDTHTGYRF